MIRVVYHTGDFISCTNGSVALSCPSLLAASCGAMGGQEDNKRRTRGQQAARKPCKSQEARPVPKRDLLQQGRRHWAARVHWHVGGSLSPSGFGMEGWSFDTVQKWICGKIYHVGDLALRGRFPPEIDFSPCRHPGTRGSCPQKVVFLNCPKIISECSILQ